MAMAMAMAMVMGIINNLKYTFLVKFKSIFFLQLLIVQIVKFYFLEYTADIQNRSPKIS